MERNFNKGDIVQHFKRETMTEEQLEKEPNLYLYEIIGIARNTETNENTTGVPNDETKAPNTPNLNNTGSFFNQEN